MSCYICNSLDFHIFKKFSELPRVTSDAKPFREGGNLAVCRQCGHIQKQANPIFEDELKEIYGNYTSFHQSRNDTQTIFVNDQQISRCEFLIRHIKQILNFGELESVLDFGCGAGSFLTEIYKVQPNVDLYAFDLDDRALPKLRDLKSFKKFYHGDPHNIDRKFSLITLIHSLEHIQNPIEILSFIKEELLEENGILFIQVPNCGENYFDLLVADHLSHFTEKSLDNLMLKTKYNRINKETDWIAKELSFLLVKGDGSTTSISTDFSFSKQIDAHIGLFLNIAKTAAEQLKNSENFGIFGTSISSTWLMGSLEGKANFFVDEDKHRINGTHLDRMIYAPHGVPKNSLVYAPFYFPICQKLYQKAITQKWPFELVFPFSQEKILEAR